MYSEDDITSAVQAGVLSAEGAAALGDFVARKRATSIVDEESFRLVTSFNDIFVAIACILTGFSFLAMHHRPSTCTP